MSISAFWKQPDLRRQLLITLLAVVIYRLATHIPLPGIPASVLEKAPEMALASGGLFQFADLVSGGAILRLSIVGLSVYPYITACGLLDTAVPVFPRLGEWMRRNREKVPFLRASLTLILALLGAAAGDGVILPQMGAGLEGMVERVTVIVALAAGAMFTMWLGDLIDSEGLGGSSWANGINVIVLANILAAGPFSLVRLLPVGGLRFALLLLALALLLVPVVLVQGAVRRVPVQYARTLHKPRLYGGPYTYLPFAVVPGGLDALQTVYAYATSGALLVQVLRTTPVIGALLDALALPPAGAAASTARGELTGTLAVFVGVVLLTLFQTDLNFTQGEYATQLQRAGGFISDVRPGKPTENYLRAIVMRIGLFGALFVGLYSILPWLLKWVLGLPEPAYAAWAVWTLCRILIDYYRVIEAQLIMRGYRDRVLVR